MEEYDRPSLPRYRCHKEVEALKIARVIVYKEKDHHGVINTGTIFPEERGQRPFSVTAEYIKKHNPQAGGYWVLYEDGYQSFSPAEAFEAGYSPCK